MFKRAGRDGLTRPTGSTVKGEVRFRKKIWTFFGNKIMVMMPSSFLQRTRLYKRECKKQEPTFQIISFLRQRKM